MDFLQEHLYLVGTIGVVALTIAGAIGEKILFHRVYPKLQSSARLWDSALVYALHFPLQIYIWLSGLFFFLALVEQNFAKVSFPWMQGAYRVGAFLLFIWALFRLIDRLENRSHLAPLRGVTQVLKAFVLLAGGLGILQFLGIPLSGVIAFGGIGGIAIGFAAKDLLANFFGGLMIFLDRPFQVGDWVRSPDKEIEGTIEQIGWRSTRIRTFDQRPLFVPNSLFSTIALENPSRMTNRRIKATLGLSYEDAPKIQNVLADIERMIQTHPGIDPSKICFANLVNFGSYALEVQIYAFTKTTQWLEFQTIQQDILLKTLEVVHRHGCRAASPVSIQLQKDLSEFDRLSR